MLPRTDIEWLESVLTVEEALGAAGRSGHSSYPVCKNGLGDVQGMITVTDLLAAENPQSILSEIKKPAVFVPETLTGMELLEQFRTNSYRMVFIVDEYGVVQGLLTAYDMLEAITGELKTIESEQPWAKLEGEGSWLLDGLMPISELKTRLDIKDLPDEDRGTYNTLAGMLMSVSGDLLKQGEVVAVEGWNFTVVKLEGKRADKIRAVQG